MQVEHIRYGQGGQAQTKIKRVDVVAAAETALRLDPGLGAAYQALGALQAFGRFAEREALHQEGALRGADGPDGADQRKPVLRRGGPHARRP